MEKLENVYRELEGEKGNLDRVRREAATHAEQDRNNLNKLRDEVNRFKNKLDESKLKGDEDKLKLELKMDEVRNERENALKEIEELHVQLHMSEDKVDELHNQLQETIRKLKEGNNRQVLFVKFNKKKKKKIEKKTTIFMKIMFVVIFLADITIESSRKELVDVRRQLTDSNYEKEKYNCSNKELRERIKQVEGDKREQARTLEEIYQKISGKSMKDYIRCIYATYACSKVYTVLINKFTLV
jgi:rootletin